MSVERHGPMRVRELLRLLPALALYVAVIGMFAVDEQVGDEGRYLGFAENLTHGFYTTRGELDLWSGPGYPLLIAPLVAAGAPLLAVKLVNGVLLFAGVCLMYATARQYAKPMPALVFAWLFAVYPPFLRFLPFLLTESLAVALVACAAYFTVRWYRTRKAGWLIASALAFGYLALTKIFFGWVLMIGAPLCLVLALIARLRPLWRMGVVLAIALVPCAPYLAYTHHLTGKPLYWGNSGGMSLYFMTSPYAGEYGDWHSTKAVMTDPDLARHKPLFEKTATLNLVERDDRFKQEALKNLRRAPVKCAMNWAMNVTRMLFSYPYSYTLQKPSTLFYVVPNALLVTLMLALVVPTIVGRRRVPPEVFALLLVAFIALGGSSVLSSEARFFAVGLPLLAVWILVTLTRVVRVRLVRELEGEGAGAQAG